MYNVCPDSKAREYAAGIEQQHHQLLALVDGLNPQQWDWRPKPGEWSIAQCVDHINTVNSLLAPRVEQAIARGEAQGLRAQGPFRYPLFDRMFIFALEPSAPVKQRAPGLYRPAETADIEAARRRCSGLFERLASAARQADGLDLVRVKIASPVSPLLRFCLGAWLEGILAHNSNHIAQASRVREHPAFPPGG